MKDAPLERGRAAAGRGDWRQAYELLAGADAERPLGGADLSLLAEVAYAAGHLDVTIETWERAHADGLRKGDRASAAAAATRVAMHLLFDTALLAPVRGWVRRAERLLEGDEDTPVHAWVAVVRAYERLLSGDFGEAGRWARRAVEIGTDRDAGATALGRIAYARSLVLSGEVQRGLELLDEAAVSLVSGELDALTTGVIYCELVCALQALAQYAMAEEWTQAMERWRHGHAVGSIHGRCRVHRAEILRLRGFSDEAEREALEACDELRPYLRREFGWPLTELGRIRLRRGDLRGAEQAFVAAHEAGWDPQPGLALVHLARGDVARAELSIRDALEHPLNVPSKELPPASELRRAPLLEAQVEIAIAANDLERARWAADELSGVATAFGGKALAASAAACRGAVRFAAGDASAARGEFATALHLWTEVGAPFESALARMGLGEAFRALGHAERALLEFRTALSMFEQVGAALHAERAAAACRKMDRAVPGRGGGQPAGSPAAAGSPPADPASARLPSAENVLHRERESWSITFGGQTTRLRDLKGLRHLARLLARPGVRIHALDLVAAERAGAGETVWTSGHASAPELAGDAGELIDAAAKDAYRRRLLEIEEDVEEARSLGDVQREAQADAERDFVLRELARAVGLGGRPRRAGSAAERARGSVTRALRFALTRLRERHPLLGAHLDRCIRTGTYCAYLPDPRVPVAWKISSESRDRTPGGFNPEADSGR